jgi:UDP-glucuronate 4-epimerase
MYNDKPITVYGYGQMRRDFTHVDDIVAGWVVFPPLFLKCLLNRVCRIVASIDYGGKDELFNLGNGHPVLLDDFIDTVERSLNKCVLSVVLLFFCSVFPSGGC